MEKKGGKDKMMVEGKNDDSEGQRRGKEVEE